MFATNCKSKHSRWISTTRMAIAGVLSTLLLVGCGGEGDRDDDKASSTNVPTLSYTVDVADDPIVGARVSAPECAKFTDNGNGSYTLQECIAKPSTITAVGGSFDMNGITIYQTAPLILKTSQLNSNASFVVTPLTTLASQEDNLSALASALGISEADLFLNKAEHQTKMREINAILNAARSAGITKYEAFVSEFKNQIKNRSGISAAKQYMIDNLETYRNTFGVVFGGFIRDLNDKTPPVTTGRVRLGGYVYDAAIPNATITILDGSRTVAAGTSDFDGRYSIEINATELETSKVLKFQAVSGKTKLISYVTTDELKAGNIGYRISSGTIKDLIISNVTTAKAVLIDKIDPLAKSNATSMVEVKLIAESLYATDILNIASSIKAVVDHNASMNQADTLVLAQEIAAGEQPANTNYTDEVKLDPTISDQLNSTTPNTTHNFKSLILGKTFIAFDYYREYSHNSQNPFTYMELTFGTDGSMSLKEYRNTSESNWSTDISLNEPAGSIQWSSDGMIAYDTSDFWPPSKHTLIRVETVTVGSATAKIYWIQDEVTADVTDGYFTNFKTTAEEQGSYNSTTNTITIDSHTIDLNSSHISTMTKFGKTYYIANEGSSGERTMYYVEGTTAYEKNYDKIGTVSIGWFTDNVDALAAYKNATQNNQWAHIEDDIQQSLPTEWNYWTNVQRAIYDHLFGSK